MLLGEWRKQGDVIALADGSTCFADPAAAKAILGNEGGFLAEHSDFFHLRRGILGPRTTQVDISRNAKRLLRSAMPDIVAALPAVVERRLTGETLWPDEGNRLIFDVVAPVLDATGRLHHLLVQVMEKSVMAGARSRRSRLDRLVFRRATMRELRAECRRRRRRHGEPRDLLDVVVGGARHHGDDALAEVFLSFVFALVGSVGFTLGWSVLMLGTHPPTQAPSVWVVREALRLWPVAWFFGRTPVRDHWLSGVRVSPQRDVTVCSYLVHRHPDHWRDPDGFQPERWAETGHKAYLPFGWGEHSCTGASAATDLVAAALDLIRARPLSAFPSGDAQAGGPALAPPPFTLRQSAAGRAT